MLAPLFFKKNPLLLFNTLGDLDFSAHLRKLIPGVLSPAKIGLEAGHKTSNVRHGQVADVLTSFSTLNLVVVVARHRKRCVS